MEDNKTTTEKKCSTHCDWPNCTYSDCMEKHPEEWAKGGPHEFIKEVMADNKRLTADERLSSIRNGFGMTFKDTMPEPAYKLLIAAIEDYADSQASELKEQIEELEAVADKMVVIIELFKKAGIGNSTDFHVQQQAFNLIIMSEALEEYKQLNNKQ